ncbi:MAG: Transketolase [Firmicutes bacterium ADurb.Bin182]|nr:MAG: Transketolase [Firmicutes bacterium ADurb.Bin182]
MKNIDRKAITAIRILAAEAVQKANSGHPGLPIGAAPMAYTLWKQMKHNPANPKWQARDRFVLSAGHASMLEYALLHLFGYGLTIEDLKNFRQWGSKTPGHPEYGHTVGVEATSGPLGQGISMAVGMAMAEAHLAAKFNREGFPVVDNFTYALTGDGDMMEGVASEAASMAGSMGLSKLIVLYDSNRITIEGDTDITFRENVSARFASYGWHVQSVENGENTDAIEAALIKAREETEKPSLIVVRTKIAYGTAKEGKASAHGEPLGEDNIKLMKKFYGWESEDAFAVPGDVYAYFNSLLSGFQKAEDDWNALFEAYSKQYPELRREWDEWHSGRLPDELLNDESFFRFEGKAATRSASGEVLNRLIKYLPNLFGGSADLAPSNKTNLKGAGDFSAGSYEGSNIHFGIREFAMAAACNGIMLYGGLRAFCATFLVFSDYLKPALRLSALMKLPVIYVLTHDSIGVGEDGPTHQPIEQLASLRSIPNTLVFRPADSKETAAAYISALSADGPSVLALSRQNLPLYEETGKGALKGAYILRDTQGEPDVILIASGSEVEIIMKASELLKEKGVRTRVVSMPCMELFDRQSEEYKKSVLPDSVRARVAVEAASSFGWHKYTGLDGRVISIDRFGASAPAGVLFEKLGLTAESVVKAALETAGK